MLIAQPHFSAFSIDGEDASPFSTTMSSEPFVLRWGIVGAGRISGSFVADLVLDPAGRDVKDVAHAVTAVGSRSLSKAEEFISKHCPEGGFAQANGLVKAKPIAKGSYEEVYKLQACSYFLNHQPFCQSFLAGSGHHLCRNTPHLPCK